MTDTIHLSFEDALASVEKELQRKLRSSPPLIGQYMAHLANSKGKLIRARCLLICALNAEERIHSDAVNFAVAIELLHLATLVHDDVIDDSQTRRGIATLQTVFGKKSAVICGDYLLCCSLTMIAAIPKKERYASFEISDYATRICLGELSQGINNGNLKLSPLRYLKIIRGKTAALFEASFHIGAILSIGDDPDLKQYLKLGRYLGMIFQLSDDCLDFEATELEAKKPVSADFSQGVITLPAIYALKSNPTFLEKLPQLKNSHTALSNFVVESGGVMYTKIVSRKYYEKSLPLLDTLALTPKKRQHLMHLFDTATQNAQNKGTNL